MKFRPLHDRVLVARVKEEAKTAGGIIIPDTAKEKPSEGKVVAVGPGVRDENGKFKALDVKKGDRSHDRRQRAADHERKRHYGCDCQVRHTLFFNI